MPQFAIIEVDDGLTIVELQAGEQAEQAAVRGGGTLVDAGPYPSFDDAYDAMMELDDEDEDEVA